MLTKNSKRLDIFDGQAIKFTKDGTERAALIQQDINPDDPRIDDEGIISRMFCWHRNYKLGDHHTFTDTADMLWSLMQEANIHVAKDRDEMSTTDMRNALQDAAIILPLWLYDHSGISMSCGDRTYPYDDPWDSGQVGWIVVLKSDMDNMGITYKGNWRNTAIDICKNDVQTYNMWLTGDIYGYQVFVKDDRNEWHPEDSCWGFYGTNILENGMCDYIDGLRTAIDKDKYSIVTPTIHTVITYEF